MQKKGELSRLAIGLLICSLIIVLTLVIWIILRGGKENQNTYDDSNLDLKISQVKKTNDNNLDVTVKRNSGEGEFVGLSFEVSDGSTTEIIKVDGSIPENQENVFSLKFISLNASKIEKISVTPIFENKKGEEILGSVKDEYLSPVCSPSCPYGAQCGNNGCGGKCGSGCASGYLCVNYKCIKQQTSSGGSSDRSSGGGSSGGGSSSGGSSGGSSGDGSSGGSSGCNDTCASLGYTCGNQTICNKSINCGTCDSGYYCNSGNCIECTPHATFNCSGGDVYWWNSCGQREGIKQDCLANQICSGGACVDCTPHATSNCSEGDVYWWNSCGQREGIRYDCNETQTCISGACVNNPVNPPLTGAIIADHTVVADFDIIPSCWIEKAKQQFVIGYGHTSHGSQITTGLTMVKAEHGNLYSFNNGGTGGALDYEEGAGYGEGWLDHDVGYGGWDDETRYYLNGNDPGAGTADHSDVNTIMWSWCGQVNDVNLQTHYFDNMEDLESEYPEVTFIYMTGHREDGQADLAANNQIRDYVENNEKVLFDFADIESYDPDGTFYPNDNDACSWCSTWCASHECPSCGSCSHSHCFNCYNKGKAFWWMLARMAGWDGTAGDACP